MLVHRLKINYNEVYNLVCDYNFSSTLEKKLETVKLRIVKHVFNMS